MKKRETFAVWISLLCTIWCLCSLTFNLQTGTSWMGNKMFPSILDWDYIFTRKKKLNVCCLNSSVLLPKGKGWEVLLLTGIYAGNLILFLLSSNWLHGESISQCNVPSISNWYKENCYVYMHSNNELQHTNFYLILIKRFMWNQSFLHMICFKCILKCIQILKYLKTAIIDTYGFICVCVYTNTYTYTRLKTVSY